MLLASNANHKCLKQRKGKQINWKKNSITFELLNIDMRNLFRFQLCVNLPSFSDERNRLPLNCIITIINLYIAKNRTRSGRMLEL